MSDTPRPSFVVNIRDGLQPLNDGGFADMGGFGHSVGRLHGLTHIGIHYEVAPPGSRSSFPHAEKLEEGIRLRARRQAGRLDRWRTAPAGCRRCAAFPAGTGIAHSFLNSDADIHLLVLGSGTCPAIACVRGATALSKAYLAPENSRRRLVHMDDFAAVEAERWVAVLLWAGPLRLFRARGGAAARAALDRPQLSQPPAVPGRRRPDHQGDRPPARLSRRAAPAVGRAPGLEHGHRALRAMAGAGRQQPPRPGRLGGARLSRLGGGRARRCHPADPWPAGVDRCPDPRAGGQCLARLDHAPPARGRAASRPRRGPRRWSSRCRPCRSRRSPPYGWWWRRRRY